MTAGKQREKKLQGPTTPSRAHPKWVNFTPSRPHLVKSPPLPKPAWSTSVKPRTMPFNIWSFRGFIQNHSKVVLAVKVHIKRRPDTWGRKGPQVCPSRWWEPAAAWESSLLCHSWEGAEVAGGLASERSVEREGKHWTNTELQGSSWHLTISLRDLM